MVMDRFGTTMLIETDGKEKQYSALNVKVSKNYVQARGDPDFCKTEGFWIEIKGTADDGSKTNVKLLISKQVGLRDLVNKFVEAI